MNYIFLGGAGEVGASCLLVSVAHRHILFDCGIRVNQTGADSLPDIDLLKQSVPTLDAIFVSHAHADHIGALPLAHAAFPQAPDPMLQNQHNALPQSCSQMLCAYKKTDKMRKQLPYSHRMPLMRLSQKCRR